MKPLNLDNSPCSPISSNCVIWQGPDIACIKLCKGDTVSDVVAKLATELCEILDTLNINNYDLSCFNLTSCTPDDFQALINFLIERICALENNSGGSSTILGGTGCPTDCIVSVIPCLRANPNQPETLNLIDYVNLIATRVCTIADQISVINAQISNLNIRVTALEDAPAPTFTIPTVTTTCTIGSNVPGSYQVQVITQEFLNNVWCSFYQTTGTSTNLFNAISSQVPCVSTTSGTMATRITNPAQTMFAAYAGFTNGTTLAESIQNLWIAICDLRNIELMSYQVNAADDITVATATVGTTTTFTVGRTPKVNFYQEAIATIDLTTDLNFVDLTYFNPVPYASLSYTNTTGSPKDYIVHASYDSEAVFLSSTLPASLVGGLGNWVDGALVQNAGTVLYESLCRPGLQAQLVDTVTNTVVDGTTPETVQTTPSGNAVDVTLSSGSTIPFNSSFFKKVTLNNGETVSLKFRSRVGSPARLLKAQIYVEEIR